MSKKVGLIVNPIAGMGGAVGLKGTDGKMYEKALALGAKPVTPKRTKEILDNIKTKDKIELYVAPGSMGEHYLKNRNWHFSVIGELTNQLSDQSDTIEISKMMVDLGVELIIFVGGDGTARNIFDAVGLSVPVVAVPSGVKIFSGIFAVNSKSAAALVDAFVEGTEIVEEEVLDIDEEAYRNNRLQSQLYGYLRVPKLLDYIQHSKSASALSGSELDNKLDVADWFIEKMEEDTVYLMGPGTTVKAVTDQLDLEKTLLGVDAIFNKKVIETDLNEEKILRILNKHPKSKIVVTPIGGNGFIFGRGNKQFTPSVLRRIGLKNIIVLSTKAKVSVLQCLRVDTGEEDLDDQFSGYFEVLIGYHEARMIKVA